METEKQKVFLIKAAFTATVTLLIYIALKLLSGVLFPFAVAAVLTVSLQRFLRKWSKRFGLRKKAASVAVVIIIYIIIGILIFSLFYVLYHQLIGLIASLPEYSVQITRLISEITEKINSVIGRMPDFAGQLFDGFPEAVIDNFTEGFTGYLAGAAGSIASGVPYFLLSVVVMIVSSAYLAKDYDEISRFIVRKVPKPAVAKLVEFKNTMLGNFVNMLRGYLIIMVITFGEVLAGLLLLRVRYSFIIAAMTAVVDILPVFGSGTVLIPWALFCVLSGNTKRAVGLIVMYIIITAVRNVAEPKIIGSKIGLHPIIMLAAVFLGLKLFGGAGIIIMPVATIIIKSIYESYNAGH